jgi:hypothetical protein
MIRFHERFACYSPLSPTPSTSAQASRGPTRGRSCRDYPGGRGWQIRF